MMQGDRIAVIADDYTGAADSGIQFARHGRKVELLLRVDGLERCLAAGKDVSLTSETRFLDPPAAAKVVRDLVRRCRAAGYGQIFKKIDSTMRGNPGAEIEAALLECGLKAALICTAMPRTGRTCVDGAIYLDGVALDATDIGRDPFHPLATARVADLLALQSALPIGQLGLDQIAAGPEALRADIAALIATGVRLIIADAVDDGHLAALAAQLGHGDLLPVGAGGFAEAMAQVCAPSSSGAEPARRVVLHHPMLSVVGSLADASRRQVRRAEASGRFQTIAIDADGLGNPSSWTPEAAQGTPANILLRVASPDRPGKLSRESGEKMAERLGRAASDLCSRFGCRTIVSTGGSTSMAIAAALGIQSVDLVDEIMPGIVAGACRSGTGRVDWFISKAGGFGEEDLLIAIDDLCVSP